MLATFLGTKQKHQLVAGKNFFLAFLNVGCVSSPVVGRKQNGKLPALSVFVCEFFCSIEILPPFWLLG